MFSAMYYSLAYEWPLKAVDLIFLLGIESLILFICRTYLKMRALLTWKQGYTELVSRLLAAPSYFIVCWWWGAATPTHAHFEFLD